MRQQHVPIRRNLPCKRDTTTGVVNRVEIVFNQRVVVILTVVGLLARRQAIAVALIGQIVRTKVGGLARERRELVIDVAAMMVGINDRANRELVLDDRDVDHGIERSIR